MPALPSSCRPRRGGRAKIHMEPWRTVAVGLLVCLVPLSVTYLTLACKAANECYVDPCMQGVGTEELWKVNKGVSTACVAGGLVGVVQSVTGLYFFVRHDPKRAQFLVGGFCGMTSLVACLMLGQSGLWMAQWNLIFDLSEINPSSSIFVQSGRNMVVRQELREKFRSLCLVAAFCCFFQTAVVAHLVRNVDDAIRYFALKGGSSNHYIETKTEQTGLMPKGDDEEELIFTA